MVAAQQEGIPKVPVEIVAYQEPRFPDRSKALRAAMKRPRDFEKEFSAHEFGSMGQQRLLRKLAGQARGARYEKRFVAWGDTMTKFKTAGAGELKSISPNMSVPTTRMQPAGKGFDATMRRYAYKNRLAAHRAAAQQGNPATRLVRPEETAIGNRVDNDYRRRLSDAMMKRKLKNTGHLSGYERELLSQRGRQVSPWKVKEFARVIVGADSGDYRVIPKRVNPLQKLTGEGKSKWKREIMATNETGGLGHLPESEGGKWRVTTEMPTTSYDYRGRNNRHIIEESITHDQLVKRAGQRNYPTVEQVAAMRADKGGGAWVSDHGKAEHFPRAAAKPGVAPAASKWSRNSKIGAGIGAAAIIGAGAYAALRKPKERQLSAKQEHKEFSVHEFGRFADALAAVRRAKTDIGSGVRLTRYNDLGVSKQVASYSIDKTRPTVWRVTGAGKKIATTAPQGRINVPKYQSSMPVFSYLHEAGHAKLHHGMRTGYDGSSALNASGRAYAPSHWRAVLGQERAANKAAVKWAGPLKKEYRKDLRPAFNTYRKAAMADMYWIGEKGTTLTHVKSAMKRHPWLRGYGFSRIDRPRVEMSQAIGYEGGVPLTGRIARDRWVKKLRDEDLDRRDANLGRAGAAGAIAGALFPSKKAGIYARMGAGALAGSLGVLGVRQATKNTQDAYGERSRGAKRAEAIPAAAALTGAGLLTAKRLGLLKKLKFEGKRQQLFFEKPFSGYNSKRHAKTGKKGLIEFSLAGRLDGFVRSNKFVPAFLKAKSYRNEAKFFRRRKSATQAEYVRVGKLQDDLFSGKNFTPETNERISKLRRNAQEGRIHATDNYYRSMDEARKYQRIAKTQEPMLKRAAAAGVVTAAAAGAGGIVAYRKLKARKEAVGSVQFAAKKEKKGLNPYVGATASGAISGAGLGFIPTILRRGSTLKGALKAGALGGLASGAIVGGGALIGSRILGEPREDEGSAFTKRAAIGGTIAGAGAGLAGGLLLRKTAKGQKILANAAKNWRPAEWLHKGPVAGSAAIGAVAGAGYGGVTGADEGQQVDGLLSLKKDLKKDVKRAAMKLEGEVGSVRLFAQDWRDARRESRSEAVKDMMTGGGVLAGGAGVGGGALWAARKFGQNADKAGAAADQVTATLKGVTKPRFVRSRQWMKKQMTTFPTFTKAMKKMKFFDVTEFSTVPRYDKLGELRKLGKPTQQLKAVLAKENARPPRWNRGLKNKLRNALDMLALENKQRLTEFYMLRKDLTEEQRNVRNAVVAGTVGVGAAAGVAAVGLRSLKKAEQAMRERGRSWNRPRSRAFEPLPGMTTPKKNLTPTMQDKWNAAKARTASSQGSGRAIRVDAPAASARQGEARRIKDVRAVSRAPIADAVPTARVTTKARIATGRKLQKTASVGNAGLLSRGERLAAASALAAMRRKFRFEHNFTVRYRDSDGKSTGWKSWAKGDQVYDDNGNPAQMGIGSLANSMGRYANQGYREARRGRGLVRDFREVAQGTKTKKREWEKSYFKDRVAGALGTAGLIAGTVVYRKGGFHGAPKWAKGFHNSVNKVGGGIKRANTAAQGWLNRQVNGFEARIEFADPRSKMEKLNDGVSAGGGYVLSAGGGAGAGAVAGRLLAGARKPALIAGAALGAAAGLGLRKSYGEKITAHRKARAEKQSTQPWQAWKHEQKAETLNVVPAALGLAGGALLLKATPKILSAANRYGNRFRQARGRMGAKMPVSKATQKARFAKAKRATAWEVGGSQAAPPNWPRLMESRMDATLRMFEGYGPYGYQDYYSAPGWDLRDARGKSARVFAPGAKKRVRRPAEWHEKKDNQKKLIAGAGIAGMLLAGGGGFMLGKQRSLRLGKLGAANAKFRAGGFSGGFGPN